MSILEILGVFFFFFFFFFFILEVVDIFHISVNLEFWGDILVIL
jgi:hypothetical protein